MRYKAILIDADDTLFDFGVAETAAFEEFMDAVGFAHPDARREYDRINTACWLDLEAGLIAPKDLRVRRFREFLTLYGLPMPPEDAAEIYETLLSEQAIVLPGALDAVREIAAKLPIAIVTNGIAKVQRGRFSRSPFDEYIAALIVSEDVGAAKPDPRMICAALDALHMPGERAVLMAGDSLKSDIGAANNAGVDSCWVNYRNEKRPEGLRITYEIPSIGDLADVALSA